MTRPAKASLSLVASIALLGLTSGQVLAQVSAETLPAPTSDSRSSEDGVIQEASPASDPGTAPAPLVPVTTETAPSGEEGVLAQPAATAEAAIEETCSTSRGTAAVPLPMAPDCIAPLPELPANTAAITATQPVPNLFDDTADGGIGIESGSLDVVDIAGIGLLIDDEGLGEDLWEQGDRGSILSLFGKGITFPPSPALAALQRDILLTSAPWPAADIAPGTVDEGQLLGLDALLLRHLALSDRGDHLAALQLGALTPGSETDPAMQRILVETRMAANDFGFCANLPEAADGTDDADFFWLKTRILCLAKDGDLGGAELLYAQFEELGGNDPVLLDVMFVLAGDESGLETLDSRDLFSVAALGTAGLAIPAGDTDQTLAKDPASIRLMMARNAAMPLDLRIALAESLAAEGLPTIALVRGLWRKLEFPEEALVNPRRALPPLPENGAAEETATPKIHSLALFWQHVERQEDSLNQLLALQDFWLLAAQQGQLDLALRIAEPVLASMEPQPALIDRAHDIVLGLAANGAWEPALAWDKLARDTAVNGDDLARQTALRNWGPLMLMRPAPVAIPVTDFMLWADSLKATAPDDAANAGDTAARLNPAPATGPHIAETALMLAALGHQLDPAIWQETASLPLAQDRLARFNPVAVNALRGRVRTASRGEIMVMVLHLLDKTSPADLAIRDFVDVLELLQQAGADEAARALAVERFASL